MEIKLTEIEYAVLSKILFEQYSDSRALIKKPDSYLARKHKVENDGNVFHNIRKPLNDKIETISSIIMKLRPKEA
tara:strand:- start:1909 stop:2133 length:225 start_codon:yes stop_codon:yes gene_type:complete